MPAFTVPAWLHVAPLSSERSILNPVSLAAESNQLIWMCVASTALALTFVAPGCGVGRGTGGGPDGGGGGGSAMVEAIAAEASTVPAPNWGSQPGGPPSRAVTCRITRV